MRPDLSPIVRLADYRPFPFIVDSVQLTFQLDPASTLVACETRMRRREGSVGPLRLDGEKLGLKRVVLNGRPLAEDQYAVDADGLTIENPGEEFVLLIETEIEPAANTELSGLYISSDRFCTQCEAEGFRRITYYPDRPDVLAPYKVRIEADRARYRYLLSNGNPVAAGELTAGRHFAEWDDPFPKPSYLFALVGGNFDVLEDRFQTMSGRDVKLSIFVEQGDAPRAAYAMDSLKRSMAWDETAFGREYDLDIFQIVAVRDFNFGAMENKGLNIFNSAYVLADGETATDADFEAIESIVAHEYFHNWTGNRITCRDWFQLCLKEGLTVFRDQEFTKAMRSPAVARIKEVIRLRARQFAEDAGPLAHPVRPDSYARIDNLYTATVYEKGAEIIRMLRLLIGAEAFREGLDRYFATLDGTAATVEDFIDCFRPFTSADLDAFSRWYVQPGTPTVSAKSEYVEGERVFRLYLSQATPPTPGQADKQPQHIPLSLALFDANGAKVASSLDGCRADEHVILLDSGRKLFEFHDVPSLVTPSLNRSFSAPIRVNDDLDDLTRARLAGVDDDAFAQWEAVQQLARNLLVSALRKGQTDPAGPALDSLLNAVERSFSRAVKEDPAFASLLVYLPTVAELALDVAPADPQSVHDIRQGLRKAYAQRLERVLVEIVDRNDHSDFDPSASAAGGRALAVTALSLLSTLGPRHEVAIAAAFDSANTMTMSLGALTALSNIQGEAFDAALGAFERRWASAPLVMDKWYGVQAMAVRADSRVRIERLAARKDYDLGNPNRVRALAASLAVGNPVIFHAPDGWGYRWLADLILRIDALNPALSARLCAAFESWRVYEPGRQVLAKAELERLAGAPLSKNARDIVERALSAQ